MALFYSMQLTRTATIRIIKTAGALALVLLIVIYAISRSMNYVRGPQIQIFWPPNGESATTSIVTINGQVKRINKLTLNGSPISTDEQGNWYQTVIIFPGLNKLTIVARDQFNRSTEASLDIFGTIDSSLKN